MLSVMELLAGGIYTESRSRWYLLSAGLVVYDPWLVSAGMSTLVDFELKV